MGPIMEWDVLDIILFTHFRNIKAADPLCYFHWIYCNVVSTCYQLTVTPRVSLPCGQLSYF